MSRTRRHKTKWAQDSINNNFYDSPKEKRFVQRHAEGWDGTGKNELCGPDSSHPKGYDSYDDCSATVWAKRAASHARRNYGKKVLKERMNEIESED